jgi:hypothetical protein
MSRGREPLCGDLTWPILVHVDAIDGQAGENGRWHVGIRLDPGGFAMD